MTDPAGSLTALRELFDARFEETGKAVRLLQENSNRQPTPEVLEERLKALAREVELRFSEMEKRNAAVAASDQKSIEVALQAQEKAAAKAETAISKQLDASNEQMRQGFAALETRLNDTRDSVRSAADTGQGKQQNQAGMLAVGGFILAAILAATAVIARLVT